MSRTAFVFSGQGDQFPGMGRDLYEGSETAREVFDLCESLRPGTLRQSFEGTDEELKETRNTQPCLFAMELAAATELQAKGIRADAVAGFSLGEVVAATCAGLFSKEAGFRLVTRRGERMQQAAEKQETSMAAVLKLPEETVVELCGQFEQVYPVNYNCPGQITVSGLASQMSGFLAAVKDAGGRGLPLKVKGAFHSPFMTEAAGGFREDLDQAVTGVIQIPLYSNVTAEPYNGDARDLLSRQISSPVRWEALIRNMIADGIDTFIEIGPGRTLTNMIRKIDPQVQAMTYQEVVKGEESC